MVKPLEIPNFLDFQPSHHTPIPDDTSKRLEEILGKWWINDFSQIQEEYLSCYEAVTSIPFSNKITVLPLPQIYKHTHGRPAAMRRKALWRRKNHIWIREMPIYEMFFELSHEIGHTIPPFFEKKNLGAEETKACFFQHLLTQEILKRDYDWIFAFKHFVNWRKEHIAKTDPDTYGLYQTIAEQMAQRCGGNYMEGAQYIDEILTDLKK